MKRYLWTPFVLAVLFALQATAFAEEPGIGTATATKNQVEGIIAGRNSTALNGEPSVYRRDGPHGRCQRRGSGIY